MALRRQNLCRRYGAGERDAMNHMALLLKRVVHDAPIWHIFGEIFIWLVAKPWRHDPASRYGPRWYFLRMRTPGSNEWLQPTTSQ